MVVMRFCFGFGFRLVRVILSSLNEIKFFVRFRVDGFRFDFDYLESWFLFFLEFYSSFLGYFESGDGEGFLLDRLIEFVF